MAKHQLAVINPWRFERNPELAGYTGRIFEREVLGECKVRAKGKLRFFAALREVIANQPGNTYKPSEHQTAEFRNAVGNEMRSLGLNPERLQVFTAVGSALDRYHGIDGFFAFEGAIVTVDCTINPHKDYSRARVIVTAEDAFDGFRGSARAIACRLKSAVINRWKGVI